MRIKRSKARVISEITIDQDIPMEGYSLTGLGAPASTNDSLRYGVAEIRNEEIAAGAAIAYAKLALTGLIRDADIKSDALIALSKLASAVYTETEVDNLFTTHAGLPNVHHSPTAAAVYIQLTVLHFQMLPATGTAQSNPEYANDNDTGTDAAFEVESQYAQIDFVAPSLITQYRIYGDAVNTTGAVWKLQYKNSAGVWTDWITDIAERSAVSWGNWVSDSEVLALGIRVVITTYVEGQWRVPEIEVKY